MEQNNLKTIMVAIGKWLPTVRIFRNNTGMGWIGEVNHQGNKVIITNPRPLHAGLIKGSSDLIGWTTVEVTPDMVGQKLAIFTAIEVKSTAKSRRSDDQIRFVKNVQKAGGIALFSHDADDVVNYIQNR